MRRELSCLATAGIPFFSTFRSEGSPLRACAACAQTSPDWQQLIDVGFVANYTARTAEGTVRVRAKGFVGTEELARFKCVGAGPGGGGRRVIPRNSRGKGGGESCVMTCMPT